MTTAWPPEIAPTAFDEHPQPFARTGCTAGALQAVGVPWGIPRLFVGHESRFY